MDVTDRGCWAEATKTTYIVPGTVLRHESRTTKRDDRDAIVGELPPGENAIFLRQGDLLILHETSNPAALQPVTVLGQVPDPRLDWLHHPRSVR